MFWRQMLFLVVAGLIRNDQDQVYIKTAFLFFLMRTQTPKQLDSYFLI